MKQDENGRKRRQDELVEPLRVKMPDERKVEYPTGGDDVEREAQQEENDTRKIGQASFKALANLPYATVYRCQAAGDPSTPTRRYGLDTRAVLFYCLAPKMRMGLTRWSTHRNAPSIIRGCMLAHAIPVIKCGRFSWLRPRQSHQPLFRPTLDYLVLATPPIKHPKFSSVRKRKLSLKYYSTVKARLKFG